MNPILIFTLAAGAAAALLKLLGGEKSASDARTENPVSDPTPYTIDLNG